MTDVQFDKAELEVAFDSYAERLKASWLERCLVHWAAFLMDNAQFNAYLDKHGLAINASFEIVRKDWHEQ